MLDLARRRVARRRSACTSGSASPGTQPEHEAGDAEHDDRREEARPTARARGVGAQPGLVAKAPQTKRAL